MDRDFICFFNLLGLAQKLGYRGCDYMYYKRRGDAVQGMCNLVAIESDSHVCDMVREYEDLKKVSLCFMKNAASGPYMSPVEFYSDLSICDPVEEEWNKEEEDEDMIESDSSISKSSDCCSIDEEQAEEERTELRKQLAEMKRTNADPGEHCEGDTDFEDLYENTLSTKNSGVKAADAPRMSDKVPETEDLEKVFPDKGKEKLVGDKGKVVDDKGKGVADENKENSSKRLKKDTGGLSPPPSDRDDGDMLCSEDDDGAVKDVHMKPGKKRRPRKRQVRMWFDSTNILDSSQFCKGLCFINMDQLRLALQSYHIVNGRDYRYLRNEPKYFIVKCLSEYCPFYLRASTISKEPTVMIRKLEEPHTCGSTNQSSRINSTWIAKVFEEQIRSDPDWKIQGLIDEIQRRFGVEITKIMAYRARAKAGEVVLGNHKAQYKRIRDYCQTVIDKNPGSIVRVATISRVNEGLNPRFFGLFMCLKAQIDGFLNGCRPFIGVDGCFVKLSNGAQVLAATSRDDNNNLFPLAFGVVSEEDKDNWIWFLNKLKEAIGEGEQYGGWTIMSDRQKGLQHAVKKVFPAAEVRYCKRHIYQNFCTAGYRGSHLKVYFDAAVYAHTKYEFDVVMQSLKDANEKAHAWLSKIPVKHWSRHAFRIDSKTDLVVNNLSEVFNNYIIDYHDKSIQTMMECIRTRLMNRTHNKREGGRSAHWEITPSMAEKLEIEKTHARYCRPMQAGVSIWQVACNDRVYSVNLARRTCECFRWDLSGLPCKHAISAIFKMKQMPENYVNEWFKLPKYIATYEPMIYPVPGQHGWTITQTEDIDPPKFSKQPGRPKKKKEKRCR